MLDKLLELISSWIEDITPFVIVPYYKRGVRLRFGKKAGILEHGFHWKIPFVDNFLTIQVKTTTLPLPEQTITTKDHQSMVVKSVVKYEIDDIETFLLEVWDANDALSDMTQGIIRDLFIEKNWDECNGPDISTIITKKARTEAEKWGIKLTKVTLTDLGLVPTYRVMGLNKLTATTE